MKESDAPPIRDTSGIAPAATDGDSAGRNWAAFGFVLIALQFALLVYLLGRFNLETRALQHVAYIAFTGFLVHHFLPGKWRLYFFLMLSVVATTYVLGMVQTQWHLGTALSRAVPLFAIGLALIGICHLPVRLRVKVSLLILAGCILAALRYNWGAWSGSVDETWIWPVLGSMFMFRLIVYLYDLQHEKGPIQPVRSLSYFFLLPNVCFPLFPVIDYKTFCRNYYNEPALRIYQRGLDWITRGIIHLLLWRIIYYEFHVDPSRVASGTDLISYILSNVGLYLRVSGQFHLAIGLLLLFGFNLPETNRRFFLASSFTDYYRRVNIYWKDFMMKVIYYPAVFYFKSWGTTWSIVVATIIAFIVTWFLHSYQTFWVRNAFPVQPKDILFWGTLCGLVIVSSLREMNKGPKRSVRVPKISWKDNVSLGLRTTWTFTVLTLLWSLWACDSVGQWLGLWEVADSDTFIWGGIALAVVFFAALILEGTWRTPAAGTAAARNVGGKTGVSTAASGFPFRRALLTCMIPVALLMLLSMQRFHEHLGPGATMTLSHLFETKPNKAAEENMVRGYYEDLQDVNPALNWAGNVQPKQWAMLEKTPVFREIGDYRMFELAPSSRIVLNGHLLTTNQWGMRDRDYALAKPPGTYRIAILGSSNVMGLNVGDGEPFESVVEDRLNRERAGRPYTRYEILNFAVNAYTPPTQVVVLDKKVLPFKPDLAMLVIHAEDGYRSVERFAKALNKGLVPDDEVLRQIVREAKVDARMPELRAVKRLMPYWPRLVELAYGRIAERCRLEGIRPVVVYLPAITGRSGREKDADLMMALARKKGFTVINLDSVYGSTKPESLMVAAWDLHANALGHSLIANGLFAALTAESSGILGQGSAALTTIDKNQRRKEN